MADPRPTTSAADHEAWAGLRRLTAARIGLQRSGASLATAPMLELRLAHARARDAVHAPLDEERLRADLAALGLPVLTVSSAVRNRPQYLMRPDLGRQLAPDAGTVLASHAGSGHDVALVVTEGLSARAVARHAQPLLAKLLPPLRADGWRMAPLIIVRQGRVAIGDAVAQLLRHGRSPDRGRPGSPPRQHGGLSDLAAGPHHGRRPVISTSGHRGSIRPTRRQSPAARHAGARDVGCCAEG